MKAHVGGIRSYVVNLSAGGSVATNVHVTNRDATESIPVWITNTIPVNVNFPSSMNVVVTNQPTIQSIVNPVTVQGSVGITGTPNVNIANQPLQVKNETGGFLWVNQRAQDVWKVSVVDGDMSVTLDGGIVDRARVWNRLNSSNQPDFNQLYVNVTNTSLPVTLPGPISITQPLQVVNAPSDNLRIQIESPTYGPSAQRRVRVGLDGEQVETLVRNSQTNQSQHVPIFIGSYASGLKLPIQSAAFTDTRVLARIAEIDNAVRHMVYNQVLSGGGYVYPTGHTDTRLLAHVRNADNQPLDVNVTNTINANIVGGNVQLQADVFDYKRFVKSSSVERMHRARIEIGNADPTQITIHDPTNQSGPWGFTLERVIDGDNLFLSTRPDHDLLVRFAIDTKMLDTLDRHITDLYQQIGPTSHYRPSLRHFREWIVDIVAILDPGPDHDDLRYTRLSNPVEQMTRKAARHVHTPNLSKRPWSLFESPGVRQDFHTRGGEQMIVSLYRIDEYKLAAAGYYTENYNFGSRGGGEILREIDRASDQEHRIGVQRYGKLVGRARASLTRTAPHNTMTEEFDPMRSMGMTYYAKAQLRSELQPGAIAVLEIDLRDLLKTGAIGPLFRNRSAYLAKTGTDRRDRTPLLKSNTRLVVKAVFYGVSS